MKIDEHFQFVKGFSVVYVLILIENDLGLFCDDLKVIKGSCPMTRVAFNDQF